MKPHRPALRYFGGKWRLAPWVISHFPEHACYVESFAGAASEFELSRERADDPTEDARRFYVLMWQGRGGHERSTGWRFQRRHARMKTAIADFLDTSHLEAIAERLQKVGIERDDAFAVLRRFDEPGTLNYVDPPYLAALRSKTSNRYRVEFKTEAEHELLLALLDKLTGYVVLSHPRCGLYEDLLAGWAQRSRAHLTGGQDGQGKGTKVEEVLWLNPRCAAAQTQGELVLFPDRSTA